MKTKYEDQIKKYGITTVDNRLAHDFRVFDMNVSDFNGYIRKVGKIPCNEQRLARFDEIKIACDKALDIKLDVAEAHFNSFP